MTLDTIFKLTAVFVNIIVSAESTNGKNNRHGDNQRYTGS